jgi:hypothetical protein
MGIVASRRGINQALQKKRGAWVFHPLEGCRLSLSELVVYSYRACQNEYQQQAPSRRQVARGVGMGRDAVARADRALMELGLLDCNVIPQEPPEGWFQKRKDADPAKHWRHKLTSWTKYVPRPDCRMSLLTVCVWSYLAHCARTGWTPKNGLGASYLCRVLRAARESVQRVLADLKDSQLVQRHDGSWCPVLVDPDWLADKWDGQKSAESSSAKVRWVELPEGAIVTIPTTAYAAPPALERSPNSLANDLFVPLMMRPGTYTLEQRQAMVRAVLATPDWKEDAESCYLEMSRAVDFGKTGEEWLRVEGWLKSRNGKA